MSAEEAALQVLKHRIREERGFNIHLYKDKCLRRRIAVRMRARGETTYGGYVDLLARDAGEYDLLLDALTINVTRFFRNQEVWAMIEEEVIPGLFAGAAGPRRVWSAGCASGEELYSVSILLHEWARRHRRSREMERFHLLGTDIDRGSLAAAARGSFGELSMGEVPEALRGRWFSAGPPFHLHEAVRAGVRFEHRDLISDAAEQGQDLILCRNVIIYLDRSIQEALFDRFFAALAPGGYLVLGKVETLFGRTRTLFEPVSHRQRIFRKPA